MGGHNPSNGKLQTIDYFTFGSTGSTADFGDITAATNHGHGMSSATRTLIAGGLAPGYTGVIEYVTTASLGNATDFGDMQNASYKHSAHSSGHGGVTS